jgi:lysophospholipase L1-like esterase
MKKLINIFLGIILMTSFTACEPEFESPISEGNYTSGDADFSNYVAVGNSLTAGYTNGTLYKSGQENSFAAILARQMKLAGGGEFTQPYMDDDTDDIGGMVYSGTTILPPKLIINAAAGGPERINKTPKVDLMNIHPGPYNNMGVPGAKIFHLVSNAYGDPANILIHKANPFYVRMASSTNASVIQDAVAQNPTFFTLWIGANDVLAYATGGGTGVDQDEAGNLDPTTYGFEDITNANVFGAIYSQLVDALTANGAKGVLATIPDVSSVPYFTTIPYNPLDPAAIPTYAVMIPELNMNFGLLNQAFTAIGHPERAVTFDENGPSPLLIKDDALEDISTQLNAALQAGGMDPGTAAILSAQYGQSRQATANDLIVLTAKSVIGQINQAYMQQLLNLGVPQTNAYKLSIEGITYPLEDKWVLTEDEITHTRNATAKYNQIIKGIAQSKNLGLADMAAVMQEMSNGLVIEDGSLYTADYFNGSNLDNLSFGLDGVHPTSRGYAIIANKFIDVIEEKYGAKLPKVLPADYPTFDILTGN